MEPFQREGWIELLLLAIEAFGLVATPIITVLGIVSDPRSHTLIPNKQIG